MAINIGADSVSALYVGANSISKVYLGSDLIADTGGGGGGDYVAKWVQVSGNTYLSTQNLVAPGDDTGFVSYAYHFNLPNIDQGGSKVIWVVDPNGVYPSNSFFANTTTDFGATYVQFCKSDDGECWNADDIGPLDFFALGTDHTFMVSAKTNADGGAKVFQMYLDDVAIPFTAASSGPLGTIPFLLSFNGFPFYIFDDGFNDGITGKFSDFWVAPGQFVDWDVTANRRKVRDADGKPVYMGANGELVTGTAPAIFLSGNASEYATNKGTGGPLIVTGGPLVDA